MSVSKYSGCSRDQLVEAHEIVSRRVKSSNAELALLDELINLQPKPMTHAEVEKQLGYKVTIT